jgi:uncharacterized protein YprB with RNaseH-like and TPR domain
MIATTSLDIARTGLYNSVDDIQTLLFSKIKDKSNLVKQILSTEDKHERKLLLRSLPSQSVVIDEIMTMFNELDFLVARLEKAENLEASLA